MTKPNYAFIDSQNLNLGVRSMGWRIDYKKFRLFLKNKYNIEQAFMFIGLVATNQNLYTELQKAGFILVFKPTIRYFENGKETVKGNVDAELVLHAAAIQYGNYHQAVIVSGDGDFACLVEYLLGKNKLLKILTPNARYSRLLAQFDAHILRLDKQLQSYGFKPKKANQKDQDWRSVETLGSLGHGDKTIVAKKKNPRKNEILKGRTSIGDGISIAKTSAVTKHKKRPL